MPETHEEIALKKRPYTAFGAARKLWGCRDSEVLLDGPAGTGKTRAIIEKIVYCCFTYPGMRALLVRKTREALTESILVTLEEKVLPVNSPAQKGPSRMLRQNYVFPNGSEIIVGGMDKSSKVMSTEYDMIGTFETTELTEEDFENLTTRLRNNRVPYQQLIADCNPGPPNHWLNRRANSGKMTRLLSRHSDNPFLYDHDKKDWTRAGAIYLSKLKNLSGARRKRLYHGQWVAAEGQVYAEFDAAIHLIDPFPIPPEWRKIRVIDFGFTNPFVCLWIAQDGDGRIYLYREMYYSQRTVREHASGVKDGDGNLIQKGIIHYSEGEHYETTIADHDAEDRATLDAEKIDTIPAYKAITPGIEAVQQRLKIRKDKKPGLFVFKNALVEKDDNLEEAHRPWNTAQEFENYVYPKGGDGKPIKEEPVKINDHGMDGLRYGVAYLDELAVSWIEVNMNDLPVALTKKDLK